MRPLWAHCHLGLGMLYRTCGRTTAEDHLAIAATMYRETMYREMGMGFWLEKAQAALEPPHGKSP